MKKTGEVLFKKKLNEVFIVPPNDLGAKRINNIYKWLTRYLKTTPFFIIIPFSFLIIFLFYFIFGFLTVRITTLLQYGF